MATLIQDIRAALSSPAIVRAASEARAMVAEWCDLPKLPAMDTHTRLAVRIYHGRTVEQAAAREYLYRWALPLNQWINHAETDRPGCRHGCRTATGAWPVPHLIGL